MHAQIITNAYKGSGIQASTNVDAKSRAVHTHTLKALASRTYALATVSRALIEAVKERGVQTGRNSDTD